MRKVLSVLKRELASFFNSPVAYIVLTVFSLITAWMFTSTFFLMNQSDLRGLFEVAPIVFVFFIPAITMGLIARERHAGTIELLFTLPVEDHHIVLGKFLAAMTLITAALSLTAVHFITLLLVGNKVDVGALLSGYLGLILLGGLYTSVGVWASSLTSNQISAFLIAFAVVFVFFILEKALVFFPVFMNAWLQYASVDYHFDNMARGVIDSRDVIYFVSGAATFLLLSVRVLETRKWR